MRTVIKISDYVFYGSYQKIKPSKIQDFQFLQTDIGWGQKTILSIQQVCQYLKIKYTCPLQQKKITTLLKNGIKNIPTNILIPFLYKKFKSIQNVYKVLPNHIRSNIVTLKKAQNICRKFPQILNHQLKYNFFNSITGRVSTNVGVVKRQQRKLIPHNHKLIQMDFSAFQPTIYNDYFLKKTEIQDIYQKCQGNTRRQKKNDWYKKTFSNKNQIPYTNPFGRYMSRPIVYHLQALQTDIMSRLLIQLNNLMDKNECKILMFVFDGLIFDSTMQYLQDIFKKINWSQVFVKSNIVKNNTIGYPFKLNVINY